MKDWSQHALSDLGNTYTGLSGKSKKHFGKGKHYIPYTNIFNNSKIDIAQLERVEVSVDENQNIVKIGDIFFTTSSETIEEVGMSSVLLDELKETYLNSFCFGFRLHDFKTLLPDFAQYLFRSEDIRKKISDLGRGSTRYNLPKAELKKKLVLDLPCIKEQSLIATILSKVDEAIEKTNKLIAKYQRIKTGLMQDLLTKGIDENGSIRSETTHKFKDSPVGRIPEEWDVEPLGKLANVSSGITLGKSYEGPDTVELPYLRVANVQDGYLDLSEITLIKIRKKQVARYLLKEGDVLMNEGGDFDKLGRGTIWKNEIDTCLHQNHVFKVRCNQEKLLPHYLELVSSSPYGKQFFIFNSKQSTNLASINKTQLSSFPIPTPKCVAEQKRITVSLGNLSEMILIETNRLNKLNQIKTGLMQDLLSGKVRVIPKMLEKFEKLSEIA